MDFYRGGHSTRCLEPAVGHETGLRTNWSFSAAIPDTLPCARRGWFSEPLACCERYSHVTSDGLTSDAADHT